MFLTSLRLMIQIIWQPTTLNVERLYSASCELSVASCELSVASCELSVASWFSLLFCELRVASCELRVASCELRVASCELVFHNINSDSFVPILDSSLSFLWVSSMNFYFSWRKKGCFLGLRIFLECFFYSTARC